MGSEAAGIPGNMVGDIAEMNLTAVVANFYEERQKYWPQIREALKQSTRPPDKIIVWNNDVRFHHGRCPESHWIDSTENTLLGRYAAIFLCETDYVFVQDNDLVIRPQTIERLFAVARDHQDKIVGVAGCRLGWEDYYAGGNRLYTSAKWIQEGPVDVVLGRCWLAHRKALAPGFARILSENINPGRADDIFFSMCAGGGIVVPCEYTNLDEEGKGLSHEPQHFEERDEWARRMLNDRQNR